MSEAAQSTRRDVLAGALIGLPACAVLLSGGVGALDALAGAPGGAAPDRSRPGEVALDQVTVETFSPHVGTRFVLRREGARDVTLTLAEATPLGDSHRRPGDPGREQPFSLVFRGPLEPALAQRTYLLLHPALGRMEIFLVPIGPDADGARYEAVFN